MMETIKIPYCQLYKFEFADLEYSDNLLEKWKDSLEWMPGKTEKQSCIGYRGKRSDLNPYDEVLFTWFKKCLDICSLEILGNTYLDICDSWLTRTKFGQSSLDHFHSYSILSGVYYFNDSKTAIEFTIDNIVADSLTKLFPPMGESVLNRIQINPTRGTLLIFPSSIFHKIQTNKFVGKSRFSLAWNSFLNGVISDKQTRYLNIKLETVAERYYRDKKNNGS